MLNNKEIKQLQPKILEIALYFDDFCKKNNLTYYLMGGSALGAVRHSGFIPWDDDFDVFMDYHNYSRFINLIDDKIDKKNFYFQAEGSNEWPLYFSKIRMNDTTYIEKDLTQKKNMHHGIYIDIMCLNNTSQNKFLRYVQYLSARLLSAKALTKQNYQTSSIIKKIILFISKYFISLRTENFLLNNVRRFNNQDTMLVGHFFGRAPFKKTSFKKAYLGKQKYVKFENSFLPVPCKVEKYLKVRYGSNFMEIPSMKERNKYPSHAFIVDIKKSYKEYIEDC